MYMERSPLDLEREMFSYLKTNQHGIYLPL